MKCKSSLELESLTVPGLTIEQRTEFAENGYLVVPSAASEAELDALVAEYSGILDALADELLEKGVTSSRYSELDLAPRLAKIYMQSGSCFTQRFDMSLPLREILSDTPFSTGPALLALLTSSRLLDLIESLIDGEIYSNPVQHVRLKPPRSLIDSGTVQNAHSLITTPWHQDNGIITEDADDTEIITVWIPLYDVDEEVGCLQVVPGSHLGGIVQHCPAVGPDGVLGVTDDRVPLEDAVSLPMARGSVLILHRRTLHAALPNKSDRLRWSLDLRYQPIGQPTGRDIFPGFVARSRNAPHTEMRDAEEWTAMWEEARDRLAVDELPTLNRWFGDAILPC